MKLTKSVSFALVLIMIILSLCACSENDSVIKYNSQKVSESISTQVVAQNDDYDLLWNDDSKCVVLNSKLTNKVWSTIPNEVLSSGNENPNLNSTLNIVVNENQSVSKVTVSGYTGAFENGRIIAQKTENGVKVLYCFDEQKITIPVTYTLRNDSVSATINSKEITECGDFSLVSISLSPYFASVNNKVEESYLFIPSGSGALMYTKETVDGTKKFTGEIYGSDAAELLTAKVKENPKLYLPVFGAKEGGNALFAIIEKGAESALIDVESGNKRTGFSNIYPTFKIRGIDTVTPSTVNSTVDDVFLLSENKANTDFTVSYYPLHDDEATYSGMAKKYREYLNKCGELEESEKLKSAYNVTLFGGTLTTKTTLGIPNKKLSPLTTLQQAEEILSKLQDNCGIPGSIRLIGYGDSGVLPGKLAGGFSVPSLLGTESDFTKLENYCSKNSISMYTDYDIIRFLKSGNGFSTISDSTKSASLKKATRSYKILPQKQDNKEFTYYLLGRDQIFSAADKLLKYADKNGVSGISLKSLGSIAYSDFSNSKYVCKAGFAEDANKVFSELKKKGHKIASDDSFGYAAAKSDIIYDVPIDNGNYNVMDETIPFYQMVFSGYKTMVSSALNLAGNPQKQMMLSAQSGLGLNYSLIYDFDINDMEINSEKFYGMSYKANLSTMSKQLEKYESIYKAVDGSALVDFEKINSNIYKSTFDNGTIVYTNNCSEAVVYNGTEFEAYGFVLGEG